MNSDSTYDPKYDADALKVGRRGPDKLLTTFSKPPFLFWLLLSLGVHGGIGLFVSYGYLLDHYIAPEGAAARKAASVAAESIAKKPSAVTAAASAAKRAPAAPRQEPAATAASTNAADPLLAERKDTPVVKRVTEPAKASEIPKQPGDLGISVEDTNVK